MQLNYREILFKDDLLFLIEILPLSYGNVEILRATILRVSIQFTTAIKY